MVYALAGHAFGIHPGNVCSNSFSDKCCWLSCSALLMSAELPSMLRSAFFHQLLLVSHLGVGGRGNYCLGQILRPSPGSRALKERFQMCSLWDRTIVARANMPLSIPGDMVTIEQDSSDVAEGILWLYLFLPNAPIPWNVTRRGSNHLAAWPEAAAVSVRRQYLTFF